MHTYSSTRYYVICELVINQWKLANDVLILFSCAMAQLNGLIYLHD